MSSNAHHTKLKGDIAVSAVIFDLSKKGYFISVPLSENSPYDILCDVGSKILRIQVKYRTDSIIPTNTTWADKNGTHRTKIDVAAIDYFALVTDDFTKIAYCPSSMIGSTIRFDLPNSYTPFNWYEDYMEFGEVKEKRTIHDFNKTRITDEDMVRAPLHKIAWPSNDEMKRLVWEMPSLELAKKLGVTDTAIYRHCKKNNISKPPRGYWNVPSR